MEAPLVVRDLCAEAVALVKSQYEPPLKRGKMKIRLSRATRKEVERAIRHRKRREGDYLRQNRHKKEFTIHDLTFDFEKDLPKPPSNPKKDTKIICRYWLENRCMNGEGCKWLHSNAGLMPICQFGLECTRRPQCPYRHIDEQEVIEVCPRYEAGFCSYGPACHKEHVKKGPEDLPRVAAIIAEMTFYFDGDESVWSHGSGGAKQKNDLYKTSICKMFGEGKCQYGDRCNFAHGYQDLQGRGKDRLAFKKWYQNPDETWVYHDHKGRWWKEGPDKKLVAI